MNCKKCKREIPEGSLYCNFCGKKQREQPKTRRRKRAKGTGTITKDVRYKNPYIVRAPSATSGMGRIYIGAYATMKEAQIALDDYLAHGRPKLCNATLADIYKLWSEVHFPEVSKSACDLYSIMWKRFAPIQNIKMSEIKTAHLQQIVDTGTSKSACNTIKAMASMMCRYAMENDITNKNYADFLRIPKFEKKEKRIFTSEEINTLWEHSDDDRAMTILLMIYTGFRIGEILKLKAGDVNLDDGYIIGGEKTDAGKNRIVPLPPEIPELFEFVRELTQCKRADEPLFPMSVSDFRTNIFYGCLVELGLVKGTKINRGYKFDGDHLTPHSTRHTFASLSSAAGMRQENLQKILGHANYATTANVYVHQNIDVLRTEMSKLTR